MRMIFCHAVVTYLDNGTVITTRATFATHNQDGAETKYTAAWCSPNDNFNRKTGRSISGARLRNESQQHVHTVTPFTKSSSMLWGSVFADAVEHGPRGWEITDISFWPKTSTTEVVA